MSQERLREQGMEKSQTTNFTRFRRTLTEELLCPDGLDSSLLIKNVHSRLSRPVKFHSPGRSSSWREPHFREDVTTILSSPPTPAFP